MTLAIVAAIITAVIIIGAISVVVLMRARADTEQTSAKTEISQLDVILGEGAASSDANDVVVSKGGEAAGKSTGSLSRRFLGLSVLTAGIFATLGAKLMSMQVFDAEGYATEAEENLYTNVSTPAPRGVIYDKDGRELVINRMSQTVLAEPEVIDDPDTIKRLSVVLGIPVGIVRQRINDASSGAQSQRVVASDVTLRDVSFISEHSDAFDGVTIEARTVRDYPYGALAAHVLGYAGAPTDEELKASPEGRVIEPSDTIGKSGVEAYYDSLLSGDKGDRRVMVDASGNVVSVVSETPPVKGSDLYLTIDSYAQYVADSALANTIAPGGDIGTGRGVAGAVVALDAKSGGVLVMASYPTFDPSHFTNGIPQYIWDLYNTEESEAPLVNRAVNGQYAAASTFKAFTSMAGLEYGFADEEKTWVCGGSWDGFQTGSPQKCWLKTGHGTLDLHGGIVNSCDVVFYEIAKAFFDHGPEGTGEISDTALQDYIRRFNFGEQTGIDLNNESAGRIPTPEWKANQWRNVPSEATWVGGDYTNMVIGQGDVLITPLQLVVGYGGIATGKLMKPHLLDKVMNTGDEVVLEAEDEVISEPEMNPKHLSYVRESLHDMILQSKSAGPEFAAIGVDAAGKSGTAEHTDRPDDAWFVAYAPYDDPKYIVACVIEQGGGGSEVAAPIVAKVMGALVNGPGEDKEPEKVEGSSGHAVELAYTGGGGRTD